MKLRKLQLENFRSHTHYTLALPEEASVTFIVGDNGKGKTNILEALYVLSLTKSFRSAHQTDLIQWEKEFFRCQAEVSKGDEATHLEVSFQALPAIKRRYQINEVPKTRSGYIGAMPVVLFSPEDLNILYLSPALRRRYLDIVLSQSGRAYLEDLTAYHKTLSQRNALLERSAKTRMPAHDLPTWDSQLVQYGVAIIQKRQNYVEFLETHLTELYRQISCGGEDIKVHYKTNVPLTGDLSAQFYHELEKNRPREQACGHTITGPHRDDLQFFINTHEITHSASRGEFRTLLLALKLAEMHYLREKIGHSPLMLLDDVFSELDPLRQAHLLNACAHSQILITTTDLDSHAELLGNHAEYNIVKM